MALVESYVVHAINFAGDDFKHFRLRREAAAYASTLVKYGDAHRADIYSVPVGGISAPIAIAALKTGFGELVESRTQ